MPTLFQRFPGNVTHVGDGASSPYLINTLVGRVFRIDAPLNPVAGAAIKGRKGWRIYISMREIQCGDTTYHQILAHEKYHTNPIIGRSEIIAHFIGGLRRRKGKLSWRYAIYEVLRLATERRSRFVVELTIFALLATSLLLLL